MTVAPHPGQHPADSRLADRLAITALNDAFGACLDHGDVEGFVDLFTEDVRYGNGPRVLTGRAELAAFFHGRAAAGRVSRHLYSGLRIRFDGDSGAIATSVWLTFAGDGPAPVASTEPFLVADVTDSYRQDRGVWRISARTISAVFRNPAIAPPSVAAGST